jgi:NAD+ kinase
MNQDMENKIRGVVIAVNEYKKEAQDALGEAQSFFAARGVAVKVVTVGGSKPDLSTTDLAISFGGDGTLLYCARLLAGKNIPILAINLGDFGFITEITKDEWKEALGKYLDGQLKISRRIMLAVQVQRRGAAAAEFISLNDAVVRTSGTPKIIRLQVYVSGTNIGRYRADGVIVATPTGSTAYSMSAGGPILHPEMAALILIPICPFTLSNRPIVIPYDERVEILIEEQQRTDLFLTVDGQESFLLLPKDRVVLRRTTKESLIIQSDKRNFYEVLRSKLNWAGEPNA